MEIKHPVIWKLISYQYSTINITQQHKLQMAFVMTWSIRRKIYLRFITLPPAK